MSRKKPLFLGLLLGLMAMAFVALPAMASAAPSLTSPKGTLIPVGTTITATSTNATTTFPAIASTLVCKKSVVNGTVSINSGTEAVVGMDGAKDTATECTLNGTSTSVGVTFTEIKLTAGSKTAKFDFTAPGVTEECTPTLTYTSGGTSVHAAGPCTGTFAGTFTGDFTAVVPLTGNSVLFD